MNYHIIQLNDLEEHEESTTCKCYPSVDFPEGGNMLIIHNSFDKRELKEKENETNKI